MCRAIRVLLLSDNDPRGKAIRAAVGAEAEVVAQIRTSEQPNAHADVVVVDGTDPGAATALSAALAAQPRLGVIWIGAGAPASVHATVEPEGLQGLPSAITRALISRR